MKIETREHDLPHYFYISLIWHVSVIGSIFFLSWLIHYFNIPIPLLENRNSVTLAQTAVRVDLVSMPKMTIKELESMTPSGAEGKKDDTSLPSVQEKNEPATTNENSFLKERRQQDFAQMLKQMSKKKIDKKNLDKLKGMKGELDQLLLAGNKLSKGNSTTGITQEQLTIFSTYISRLPDHVRQFWRLPAYLGNQDYKCRIRVFLSQNGDLIKAQIFESSGNDDYDRYALQAVRSASPYPEVSLEIRETVLAGNIILGFPL